MKINKEGIRFNHYGDELVWFWPWKRTYGKYFSDTFDRFFTSLVEYWQYVGAWNEACRKEKVVGYSDNLIFTSWACHTFQHNIVVILRHINVEMKSTLFWKSLDFSSRKQLLKDVPVLFFNTVEAAEKVARSIEPEFADVLMLVHGKIYYSNNGNYEVDLRQKQQPLGLADLRSGADG